MNSIRKTNKMSPIQKLIMEGKKCKDNSIECEKAKLIYTIYEDEYNKFREYYNQMNMKKINRYNNISRLSANDGKVYAEVINMVTDRIKEMSTENNLVEICIMLEAFKNAFYLPLTDGIKSLNKFNSITPSGKMMYYYTEQLSEMKRCNDPEMPQLINNFLGYSNNFQQKLELARNNSGISSDMNNSGMSNK